MPTDWSVYEYEVGMFRDTLRLCTTPELIKSFPQSVRNAIVESMLLHIRILVDVLLSRRTASDDITLKDLLPSFTSPRLADLKTLYGNRKEIDSCYSTLNKRLAHASNVRGDHYNYGPLLNKLGPTISTLLQEIQAEREKTPT